MAGEVPMQEMNETQPESQAQPQGEQPQARSAAGYYGPDQDRMDRAAADLDAALERIGSDATVDQMLAVAQIQALIGIAGELRSIREAGISQGDVL